MTVAGLRKHEEYAKCMERIEGYSRGYEFTLSRSRIPLPQWNGLKIVMRDAREKGLVEVMRTDLTLDGEETCVTYRRL